MAPFNCLMPAMSLRPTYQSQNSLIVCIAISHLRRMENQLAERLPPPFFQGLGIVDAGRCRHCASIENAKVHAARMGRCVPSAGEVRFLTITGKQFGRIETYVGKNRKAPSNPPAQLEFF